ncbi:MAG: RnfABCDGE type electron transport complex subunit B [Candidatus Omnitrophota bacterium]|nr:RnfABCDGE type electron transport complex subunit B [Candidatus Omnitrophota bacterium]MBU1929516.1 RnfABCDGE type electron transport complex subunit B [Candidatus Omnitrophota bacterium]MBU2035313.1 RnfABCDGE type electron transport complex subunit B [Candidatus Omnitrophota bacterium]MBU2258455.1 RnfABCDGE type electron transport complex subunit B [Candidatus Omnitrophota bacterium]
MEIIIPSLVLGALGLAFGIGLSLTSKKFTAAGDPRLDKILSFLPGANCGACGKAGCQGFAESLLSGGTDIHRCKINTENNKQKIAQILGQRLDEKVRLTAILRCNGGKKVKDKFSYTGFKNCSEANLALGGGQKECFFGCLGFGDCSKACPFRAIKMSEDFLPVIDAQKCRACNKCVEVCPKKLFFLAPYSSSVYVACSSLDPGKDTRIVCSAGCIACRACEKTCKYDAIHLIDNLAIIDYNKCTSCGDCVKVCPAKTIRIRQ